MIFLGMNQNDPSNEHDKTGEKGSQIHRSMLFLSLNYSSPIYCTFPSFSFTLENTTSFLSALLHDEYTHPEISNTKLQHLVTILQPIFD